MSSLPPRTHGGRNGPYIAPGNVHGRPGSTTAQGADIVQGGPHSFGGEMGGGVSDPAGMYGPNAMPPAPMGTAGGSAPASDFGSSIVQGGPHSFGGNVGGAPMGAAPTTPDNISNDAARAAGSGQLPQRMPGAFTPGVTGAGAWEGGYPIDRTNVDFEGLPDFDTDFSQASQNAADEAYAGLTQFMDGDFENDRAGMEARLVNQGFQPGSEAFDRQMEMMQRGQNNTRMQAAIQAGQIGHTRAGDLLTRALASRASLVGERERAADRTFGQSLGAAGLALGARGQDRQVDAAMHGAAAASAGAAASRDAARYNTDTHRDLTLRQLGLSEDSMNNQFLLNLINSSRGGVNMPNFGGASPLDVGSAYQIAGANRNSAENRSAVDRGALAGLGAAAIGGLGNYFAGR